MIKRTFDILAAAMGLFFLSPLLLLVAVLIRRDGGPAFYRGSRTGLNGKEFKIYKFRSMVVNAEKIGASSTSDDDCRITPVGKIIRRFKIDELPQLINVLKGEMSFVGPRPEVKKFTDIYTEEEKVLLELRPGITDWASLWNSDEGELLAGSLDPDKDYLEKIRPKKIQLQLKYYKERSFLIDIKIILLTILKVAGKPLGLFKGNANG
jgi:lipopolysaccharide/colanic/teichoic acid biosynthesis glycosyltransferase